MNLTSEFRNRKWQIQTKDKSSIFSSKHLHAHKCISRCDEIIKEVRYLDFDRRDFDINLLSHRAVATFLGEKPHSQRGK